MLFLRLNLGVNLINYPPCSIDLKKFGAFALNFELNDKSLGYYSINKGATYLIVHGYTWIIHSLD